MEVRKLETDVLIIGGGTAGCFAAITIGKKSNRSVLVVEKANIQRSGCLAAGVNAINAYITEGKTPQFYVDYAKKDADGIVREDLLLSMSERLNHVTKEMEDMGLVILKDENGKYVTRGTRNIKINGENIKVLLAEETRKQENVTVINHVNITDLKTVSVNGKTLVVGAYGFHVDEEIFYDIHAKAVLCACGGAAGLYRPNNPGFSRHKMWYPPFNTGAGYAMGIQAGAEMTTFEMRFIALRCKDTIAPTGTIAQGVGAKQVNSKGEIYEDKYGLTTSQRVYGTVMENRAGRGPCYLKTEGISKEQEQDLYKAYLNMAPSQTLKWLESGKGPSEQSVEIEGTEPYIVGGHTASGYWVDDQRRTTLQGLYAAGDVAGGCPQKYVTGALAEGEIAAEAMLEDMEKLEELQKTIKTISGDKPLDKENKKTVYKAEADRKLLNPADKSDINSEKQNGNVTDETDIQRISGTVTKQQEYEHFLNNPPFLFTTDQLEEAMQKVMDQYAGGIGTDYQYNEKGLSMAQEKIAQLYQLTDQLAAEDMDELLRIYELRERLIVCRTLIAHLAARKETRWHSFAENADHPEKSADWMKYVNSKLTDGKVEIICRDLVTGGMKYEHTDTR